MLTKKIVTHGGSSKGEKKGGSKKEDEKEESKSNNREGGNFAGKNNDEINRRNRNNVEYVEYHNDTVELPHKWRTHPRLYGKDSRYCRVCRNTHGLIRKYGLNICRKCFRERAHLIGFKQTK